MAAPPLNPMCSTEIDARGVQTVQTDSALTTWFGRYDYLGGKTDQLA